MSRSIPIIDDLWAEIEYPRMERDKLASKLGRAEGERNVWRDRAEIAELRLLELCDARP